MKEGRDRWLQPLLDEAPATSMAEVMDAKTHSLFSILPARPKTERNAATTAGYMVYTAYT
jgi:acetyl-CoA synthetase